MMMMMFAQLMHKFKDNIESAERKNIIKRKKILKIENPSFLDILDLKEFLRIFLENIWCVCASYMEPFSNILYMNKTSITFLKRTLL